MVWKLKTGSGKRVLGGILHPQFAKRLLNSQHLGLIDFARSPGSVLVVVAESSPS